VSGRPLVLVSGVVVVVDSPLVMAAQAPAILLVASGRLSLTP